MRKLIITEQSLQEWYAIFLTSLGVLYCASCGGMRTNIRTAIKMKKSGYKKGFPDMAILEPRGIYKAMFVELKSESGVVSKEQKQWRDELNKRGYYSIIMPSGLNYRQAQDYLEKETLNYLNKAEA